MATVAFVSPLPPAKTGIATYAASVLEGLDQLDAASGHAIDPVSPCNVVFTMPVLSI